MPIIAELHHFQTTRKETAFVYLPSQQDQFAGQYREGYRSPNPKDHPARSAYHAVLMTSRVFAGVEILMILSVVKMLLRRAAIPLCLEHEAILVMREMG